MTLAPMSPSPTTLAALSGRVCSTSCGEVVARVEAGMPCEPWEGAVEPCGGCSRLLCLHEGGYCEGCKERAALIAWGGSAGLVGRNRVAYLFARRHPR